MKVYVKDISDKRKTFNVEPTTTINELNQLVSVEYGIPIGSVHIYSGFGYISNTEKLIFTVIP